MIEGYAAGLDAWISHVRTTPGDLPAEYALLSTLPEPWTATCASPLPALAAALLLVAVLPARRAVRRS